MMDGNPFPSPPDPILVPFPKYVKCPRCGQVWVWRTWYNGNERATCSNCKVKVIPEEVLPEKNNIRLVRCTSCGLPWWYSGNKRVTTCVKCKKKNVILNTVTPDNFDRLLQEVVNREGEKYIGYYKFIFQNYLEFLKIVEEGKQDA